MNYIFQVVTVSAAIAICLFISTDKAWGYAIRIIFGIMAVLLFSIHVISMAMLRDIVVFNDVDARFIVAVFIIALVFMEFIVIETYYSLRQYEASNSN